MSLDWDVMSPVPPQPDTDGKAYQNITSEPRQLNNGNRQTFSGPIVMRTKNKDSFYNLFDAYVEVDFSVVKSDDTAMGLNDICTLINAGWHLFDRATLSINNEIVEDVQLPGKVALWNALTKYTPTEAEEVADNEFIYLDEYRQRQGGGGPDPTDYSKVYKAVGWAQPTDFLAQTPIAPTAANIVAGNPVIYGTAEAMLKFNAGYMKRFIRTRESRTCRLNLPLRSIFGLADLQKPIRGVAIQVTLYKSTDYNHILHSQYNTTAAVQTSFKTLLKQCTMWISSVMPSKETEIEVESQLVDGASTTYQFVSRTCYRSEVMEYATTRIEYDVGALTSRPLLAIIGFMSEGQIGIQYDSYSPHRSPNTVGAGFAVGAPVNAATDLYPNMIPLLTEEYGLTTDIGGRIQNHCNNGGMTSHLNNIRRLSVRINDFVFPGEPYRMSFDDESTLRAYNDYLAVWGKGGEQAKCLPYSVWKEMPLFCFRFHSPDAFYNDRANVMRIEADVASSARALNAALDAPDFGVNHRGIYGNPASGPGNFQLYCVVYYERNIEVSADGGYMRYAT